MPRGAGGGGGRPKEAMDLKTVKRILSYFKDYKVLMIFVLAAIIINSIVGVVPSIFVQTLVDDYIMPLIGVTNPSFAPLIQALVILAGIFLLGVFCSWFYNWFMVSIAQRILKTIRDEMFAKMQKLPIKFFDTNTTGDIMSRYTNDTDTLRQLLAQSIPGMLSSVLTVVSVFFAMLYLSVNLTLIVVVMLTLMFVLSGKVAGKSGKYFMRQQQSVGDLNGFVEEMVNGQKVVKVFSHEEKAKADFRAKNTTWQQSATRANGIASLMMPMMNAIGSVQYVLLAVVGGAMAVAAVPNISLAGAGTVSLGTIASFLVLVRSITNPIGQMASQLNSVVMAVAGAKRIFQLIDEEPEADNGYVTLVHAREQDGQLVETQEHTGLWAWKHPHEDGNVTYTKLAGNVVFDDVDFSYVPEKPVLHNISLFAKPGQKIAFVGATGAGKTTITNLINRFYDIDDGKIRYDGININKIKKADLRQSLGVVLQDVNLFTGTVMENIRYGNLEADDEACIAAAKLANAHEFISRLPEGYQTVLQGDGSGLSQGQRQLLSIARAAVSDPPVMILDEATSSIDTRTEALVQEGMDGLMEGRTVFVIAHRLSTVRNSKAILVMDHGRIIERGNHDELMDEGGMYYQLYTGAQRPQ